MVNIIIIAILILPWLIIPSNSLPDPTRLIKSTFFDFTMMAIIVWSIINGMKFEYKNKYLGWLAIATFFGFGFNWYYPLLVGYGYNAGTIEPCLHFIFSLIATICICSTLERNDFVKISKAICFSATLVAIFGVLQGIGLDPMKKVADYIQKENRHICAFLDHPNVFGNYLALSIPFFLYLMSPRYIVPLLIVFLGLFFSHSSLSVIAAFVSFIVFYFLRNRKFRFWKIGLCILFSGLVLLCTNPIFNKIGTGFTGRTQAWQTIFERSNNPIFGQGLGIVKSLNVRFGDNYWTFAHNDYLEIYCAGGLVLLFLFLLVIVDGFRRFNYREENILGFSYLASFVAFLILMVGSFPMEIAPLALGGLISWWGIQKVA